MSKKKCKTCDDEGVCWVLESCPDCEKGYQVSNINDQIARRRISKYPKKSIKEKREP